MKLWGFLAGKLDLCKEGDGRIRTEKLRSRPLPFPGIILCKIELYCLIMPVESRCLDASILKNKIQEEIKPIL